MSKSKVGVTCHLNINEHSIIVRSPGQPIPPITLEQLQNFDAPTLSRNPQIFSIFAELGMVERRGLGMEIYKSLNILLLTIENQNVI